MENTDIIITISGKTKTGKSRLTYLLREFLNKHGFIVKQELNQDFSSIIHFDTIVKEGLNESLDKIKVNSRIILKEEQLKK